MTELWYPGAYAVNIGGNGNDMSVSVSDINDIFHIVAASWNIDPNDPKSLDYSGGYWKTNKPATTYTDKFGAQQQFCPITSCVNGTKDGNYRNNTHEAWNPPPVDGDLNLSRYTDEQAERFADWLYWRHKEHGFIIQDMRDSRRTSHGVGVHRYGITAYKPWTSVGGEIWSTSSTKLCPGDARIVQVQTEIIPRALELVRLDPGYLPPGRVDLASAWSRGKHIEWDDIMANAQDIVDALNRNTSALVDLKHQVQDSERNIISETQRNNRSIEKIAGLLAPKTMV